MARLFVAVSSERACQADLAENGRRSLLNKQSYLQLNSLLLAKNNSLSADPYYFVFIGEFLLSADNKDYRHGARAIMSLLCLP